MKKAFGADLSLNHGSVISIEMTEDNKVINVERVYGWDVKDSHKLTVKSTPAELHIKAKDIISAVFVNGSFDITRLAIDWTSASVYWRSRRIFSVIMGMFLGMLYEQALKHNVQFIFVSPQMVRRYWGLKGNVSKAVLQDTVLSLYPLPILFESWATEDDIDAYILAIYLILNSKGNTTDD